mmetsp:Transcript_10563/g.26606  ORF Transcript_10563/g.26606 Transcript_10563/m.26606 type:complete len:223 (-) Transcript_10563:2084-2752(-)
MSATMAVAGNLPWQSVSVTSRVQQREVQALRRQQRQQQRAVGCALHSPQRALLRLHGRVLLRSGYAHCTPPRPRRLSKWGETKMWRETPQSHQPFHLPPHPPGRWRRRWHLWEGWGVMGQQAPLNRPRRRYPLQGRQRAWLGLDLWRGREDLQRQQASPRPRLFRLGEVRAGDSRHFHASNPAQTCFRLRMVSCRVDFLSPASRRTIPARSTIRRHFPRDGI